MFKSYFSVAIHNKKLIILGVSSIVPNRNGVLFFTENGDNYEIESWEDLTQFNFGIDYVDACTELPEGYEVKDCRAK